MAKKIINSIDRTALTPNYAPAWFTPIKGKKSILWDSNGNNYVDFGGGIAVTCLGHSHPELIKVLKAQSTKLWHVSNYLYNEPALELSELLAKKTFADKVFFSNSGNEANEAAIKLARRYFYDQGKSEKNEIIVFTDAFHGRSMLNISAGDSKMQKTGFGPLLKGFKRAKFNEDALNFSNIQLAIAHAMSSEARDRKKVSRYMELITKAIYKEKNLSRDDLSDDEIITLMLENPILIERPSVFDDNLAIIGRPPENVMKFLK